jgi:hypothetical protein
MRKHLFLLVLLLATCLFALTQPPPQTKTATYLNNLTLFRDVFGDQNYPKAVAEDLSTDDNVYGCSSRLVAIRDSAQSFRSNSVSSLALQGFGFTIPEDATIQNISVRIRRFKDGRPPVGDFILSLMQRYQQVVDTPSHYGRFWTYLDDYPGKIYPDTEEEFTFSQSGSGNDGGFNHDETYQWTPAMVNHVRFGVRIENFPPVGHGSVAICYDRVEVTVQFTEPPTAAAKAEVREDTKPLKQPIVYPNPFTSRTSIQFTAVENGRAVVELYDINGAKVRTLFSGHVGQGQVYKVTTGDARLSKGTYIYKIGNGSQRYLGRLVKIE